MIICTVGRTQALGPLWCRLPPPPPPPGAAAAARHCCQHLQRYPPYPVLGLL